MEVTGTLHEIFDTQKVSDRFTKREFVVEVEDGRYPQLVLFQLTGDRVGALDGHRTGEPVRVQFRLRGRKWTSPRGETRYFNSLDVIELEALAADAPPPDDDADDDGPEPDLSDIPF